MARIKESEEVKAFKATLKGLPTAEIQQLTKQYKELISAVAAAKAKNEVRKSLATLPTEELKAELEEIKNENPEYIVTSYNDFSISAMKVYDKHCDNHYIIKLQGNKLISYSKNSPDITIKEIKINLMEYPDEDIEILKNGIEVGSKEEMLEFFEDFA